MALEVMLQYSLDWRWLLYGAESPWYPSARPHRQIMYGDRASFLVSVGAQVHEIGQRRHG
jgi:hypothetical protein